VEFQEFGPPEFTLAEGVDEYTSGLHRGLHHLHTRRTLDGAN